MLLIIRLSNSSIVSSLGVAVLLRGSGVIVNDSESIRVLFEAPLSAGVMRMVEAPVSSDFGRASFVNGFSGCDSGVADRLILLPSDFGVDSIASDDPALGSEEPAAFASEAASDFAASDVVASRFPDSGFAAVGPASFSRRLRRI
jgi:hypothetical protein